MRKIFHPRATLGTLWRTATGRATPGVMALDDVSLEVGQGQTLGILGGNGSGKTTLLKIVAGILSPSAGRLRVGARVASLIELGAGFDPDLSGRDNIALAGTLMGLTRTQICARQAGIIEFSGLEEDIDRPVGHYSSGMFMRLAFSLATSVDAPIVAIDEVLAVGDATFRPRCLERLRAFQRDGGTLLIVSHEVAQIASLAPRLLWLERGLVVRCGDSVSVARDYLLAAARASAPGPTGALGVVSPGTIGGARDGANRTGQTVATGSMGKGRSAPPWRGTGPQTVPRALGERGGAPAVQPAVAMTGGGGRIEGASVEDARGEPRLELRAGETMDLAIRFSLDRPQREPSVGVIVSREGWLCCFAVESGKDGVALGPLAAGPGEVTLRVSPLQLGPGRYYVSAYIRDGAGALLDFQMALTSFEVPGVDAAGSVFQPHCRWLTGRFRIRPLRELPDAASGALP